ncbi:unnamed protein product [Adineta steineri]|uniref:Uncharacterized protein n=1 Tax=Adineta steineri TaxID=433720 RepID=A0A814FIX1_9BILA|nr:unnamed protein product [Adineta steineri]CAF4026329.1 unnamed protein product [Adineta steineri]
MGNTIPSNINATIADEAHDNKLLWTENRNQASSHLLEKREPPRCYGNACPQCGKCLDWRYDGDFERDYESFNRGESRAILIRERWQRRPNGPIVTCSYFPIYHYGAIAADYGFDMCHCT